MVEVSHYVNNPIWCNYCKQDETLKDRHCHTISYLFGFQFDLQDCGNFWWHIELKGWDNLMYYVDCWVKGKEYDLDNVPFNFHWTGYLNQNHIHREALRMQTNGPRSARLHYHFGVEL